MSDELGWWAYCPIHSHQYFYFAGKGTKCPYCEKPPDRKGESGV